MSKVLTIFGTRPEAIKLAPVILHLEESAGLRTINVATAQHTDLLYPVLEQFRIRVDHDLQVMEPDQDLHEIFGRTFFALRPILERERPDLVLVQGDTTSALAGALAAFYLKVPVGHVEAGLRTGDFSHPYPEEMNRHLITRVARWHFAPTELNRMNLLAEGVPPENVFVTGNPGIESLQTVLDHPISAPQVDEVMRKAGGKRLLVLTAHRRESFGGPMLAAFRELRSFVDRHPEVAIVFPMHPNPNVVAAADQELRRHERIHIIPPLDYAGFIQLMQQAWLIVSDSGGVQEEAPTLGKPLIVLRQVTERPEALECGVAKLTGEAPGGLAELLEEAAAPGSWAENIRRTENPFGPPDGGRRVAEAIENVLADQRKTMMATRPSE